MHVVALKASKITTNLLQIAQINVSNSVQIAALKQNKILTMVLNKYLDFANVFSEKKGLYAAGANQL